MWPSWEEGQRSIDPPTPSPVHLHCPGRSKFRQAARGMNTYTVPVEAWSWQQLSHHYLSFSLILYGGLTSY